MVIPKGAKNKGQSELWIEFYYEPANAATVEAYVYYVCPVKGADVEIKKLDPGAESNPLIFPPADVQAKYHAFQFLPEELEAKLDELYLELSGG
jgi:spermidine/putrescine transport system substrate-binding protein